MKTFDHKFSEFCGMAFFVLYPGKLLELLHVVSDRLYMHLYLKHPIQKEGERWPNFTFNNLFVL